MKGKTNNYPDYEPLEPGNYPARCFRIIDLGTQEENSPKFGKKEVRKIRIDFEIESVPIEINGEEKPSYASLRVTLSMSEKATLRKIMNSWHGKTLTDKEAEDFDVFSVLGKAGYLSITHNQSGDKVFVNIDSIKPIPKERKNAKGKIIEQAVEPPPPCINPIVGFSMDPDDHCYKGPINKPELKRKNEIDMVTAFEMLPEGTKNIIRKSPEFAEVFGTDYKSPDNEKSSKKNSNSGKQGTKITSKAQPPKNDDVDDDDDDSDFQEGLDDEPPF